MPLPAVLGISAVLTYLGDLILKVWLKYSKYIVRTAGVTLLFTFYASIFILMFNLLMSSVQGAISAAQATPSIGDALTIVGAFIPANMDNALAMIITMEVIGMTFKWLTWGVSKKTYIFRA